jgi:hypothetical protein
MPWQSGKRGPGPPAGVSTCCQGILRVRRRISASVARARALKGPTLNLHRPPYEPGSGSLGAEDQLENLRAVREGTRVLSLRTTGRHSHLDHHRGQSIGDDDLLARGVLTAGRLPALATRDCSAAQRSRAAAAASGREPAIPFERDVGQPSAQPLNQSLRRRGMK